MAISNDYIRGLVVGEGCFTFNTRNGKNGLKVRIPTFLICMHERDNDLLVSMRNFLGLKNKVYVYDSPNNDGHIRGRRTMLVVREIGRLKNIIVPLFYKKLIGFKAKQFEEWLENIGHDPSVPESYKLIYRLHQNGYYDKNPKFP